MLRVALSIKAGRLLPSAILRRLGTYSRKNRLYFAFRELGRAIRTGFLLRYIGSVDLRRTIGAATNKSEHFNRYAQWTGFGGGGLVTAAARDELSWLQSLTEPEAETLVDILAHPLWQPTNLPQVAAICSQADELFFGGASGGGKTDLLLGLALTQHRRSIISRREAVQLKGMEDRLRDICGGALQYNSSTKAGAVNGSVIEFGSMKEPADWRKYQGRPHDFQGYDEAVHFARFQITTLRAWNRTTIDGQRTRRVLASNPPTEPEGYWIVEMFAPWLDEHHPSPALPGELRWFAVFDGHEVEVPGGDPIEHRGRLIQPFSRTFIPAKAEDNPHLMATGYMDTLDALPEPLRSMFRDGSFHVGQEDDVWQVIPTDWVKAAQARWTPEGDRAPMDSMGVDVARGGKDQTVIARRHREWYAPLLAYPGSATPDGPSCAALIVTALRDGAPVHVDVVGVGASVQCDHLAGNNLTSVPVNGATESLLTDRSGQLRFANKRAELYWRFRESLDPTHGSRVQLPPDRALLADLCAPKWKLTARGIQIESRGQRTGGYQG